MQRNPAADGSTGGQRSARSGLSQVWGSRTGGGGSVRFSLPPVLPVTTNCDDQGAICTKDDSGRKLSHSLSFTVSGPGQ